MLYFGTQLFLSFCLGFVFSRMVYEFIVPIRLKVMTNVIEIRCVTMLAAATESATYMQEMKRKSMAEYGIPKEIIQETVDRDQKAFEIWKASSINLLYTAYPPEFRDESRQYTWKEAISILDKIRFDKTRK